MARDELVTVYTGGDPVKAEIIKNALEGEEIRCFLEQEDQAGLSGLMGVSIKVQVPAEDVDRARRFIADHERRHTEEEPDEDTADADSEPDTNIRGDW